MTYICQFWGNKGKINEALQMFQFLNAVNLCMTTVSLLLLLQSVFYILEM